MSIEVLEAEALKLAPKDQAELAGKLLESLEDPSPDELERLWAEEMVYTARRILLPRLSTTLKALSSSWPRRTLPK